MKKIIKIVQNDPDLMHLTWVINNICTNACSYCPSDLHAGKNHHYEWDNAKKFFEILFEKYPKIHLSISGGEPSVSPFLPEIVKIFYEKNHTVSMTSNAAKPVRYWQEIAPYINTICFSYHAEFIDPLFFEKVNEAAKRTAVTVRVMMHPNHWDHCVEVFNEFVKNKFVIVEAVRIQDWSATKKFSENYTEEQLEWINNNRDVYKGLNHLGNHKYPNVLSTYYFNDGSYEEDAITVNYVNAGMTDFFGYECEIGLKELFVSSRGDLSKGNCETSNFIGNINRPDFIKWPTSRVTCNKHLCHCSIGVNVNKWIEE